MSNRKSWTFPGCKGRFGVRGKNQIIYYYINRRKYSTGLKYSAQNKKIAGQKIAKEETGGVWPPAPERSNLLKEEFNKFISIAQRSKSPGTINNYKRAYKFFFNDRRIDLNNKIKIKSIIESRLHYSNLSPVTLNSYLSRLKSFFNYLIEAETITDNPIKKIYFSKITDKPIEIFTSEELEKLFNYWEKRDEVFYLFLRFIYITAFRRNEAMNLEAKQYYNNGSYRENIIIRSKYGDRYQYFPITKKVKELLKKLPTSGRAFPYNSASSLNKKLARSMEILNIPKSTHQNSGYGRSFHTIRKTRITDWIKKGANINAIEKLSRDNYKTVAKYYDAVKTSDYKDLI